MSYRRLAASEMALATRISVIIAGVLAACTPDECRDIQSNDRVKSTIGHDALCTLESAGGLASAYQSAYARPNADGRTTLSRDSCSTICGNASVAACDVAVDLRFAKHHPEVIPPACAYQNPSSTPCVFGSSEDGGVIDAPAPPGCPFADDVQKLDLRCDVTRTFEECRSAEAWNHGRRPEGYECAGMSAGTPALAAYFATCAHLEAASVVAFEWLVADLASHDFPAELITACAAAAREETEHARDIDLLAHRFGGDTLPFFPSDARQEAARPLVDIAIENGTEGCIGELFGAAEALFRARTSVDGEVRAVLERIATEEAGHAELSFQISVESVSRLGEEEQARVWSAMVAARAALREQIERRAYDPALTSLAGIPRRTEAIAIFDALDAAVWSPMLGA